MIPDIWLTHAQTTFSANTVIPHHRPAMAWSDSTMNGCGEVPGTTQPNTWPVALFLSGQGRAT